MSLVFRRPNENNGFYQTKKKSDLSNIPMPEAKWHNSSFNIKLRCCFLVNDSETSAVSYYIW